MTLFYTVMLKISGECFLGVVSSLEMPMSNRLLGFYMIEAARHLPILIAGGVLIILEA